MPTMESIAKDSIRGCSASARYEQPIIFQGIAVHYCWATIPVFYDITVPIRRLSPIVERDAGLGVVLEQGRRIATTDAIRADGLIRVGLSTVTLQQNFSR